MAELEHRINATFQSAYSSGPSSRAGSDALPSRSSKRKSRNKNQRN